MNTSKAELIYGFFLKVLSVDTITLLNMNSLKKGAMDVGGN